VQLTRKTLLILLLILLLGTPALAGTSKPLPTVRWSEGGPGCTLRRAENGYTYYSVSTVDFQLTLAVDNQELQKISHRTFPMISVQLAFNNTGSQPVAVDPSQSTLEFSKHFQVVQRALDPDSMLAQLQQYIDNLTDDIRSKNILNRKAPWKRSCSNG
jgi:hypothetical protein